MKNICLIMFFACLFVATACKKESSTITIKGNLKNMPDGTMMIMQINDTLATTPLKDGRFLFQLSKVQFPEAVMVALRHTDMKGTTSFFGLRPEVSAKAGYYGNFLLEDGIEINGTVKPFKSNGELNLVNLEEPIKAGRQNEVFYNAIRYKEWNMDAMKKTEQMEDLVKDHPYSFHYLDQLKRKITFMTREQFFSVFNQFDEEVKQSKTGRAMASQMQSKEGKKLDKNTLLSTIEGTKKPLLDSTKKLQMIVFWASWCGPCRQEIPELKKLHTQYANHPDFKISSVSYDENIEDWKPALAGAQMNWEQLLMPEDLKIHQYDLFQFSGSLPTTIIVDSTGKIIYKSVGFDKNEGLVKIEEFVENRLVVMK